MCLSSFQAFSATASGGNSVSLAWNPCEDANVAGYKIYFGAASHSYTSMVDVGNAVNATISGLAAGETYYFAATTYDSAGIESDFSNEASYTVLATDSLSPPQSQIQIRRAATGRLTLTVSGPGGHTYELLASQDLVKWKVIATMTLGAGGLLDFTDPYAANYPQRFYRMQETQSIEPTFARARMQIQRGAGKSYQLTVTGLVGHTYDIEATEDFFVWTVIGTVTPAADGSVNFTDPDGASFPQRFYRTRENP